ncbi:MAG: alpha/beta fold hydrolase [Nitrosospira sp.]|nr:alpha/beta fold hydrolase [Nitrosospira sp.]
MNVSINHGSLRKWAFQPAMGLQNPHLQTLLGASLPSRRPKNIRRERRELPDGDFADIDWLENGFTQPWALIIPGIAGNLSSPCTLRLMKHLSARGYRAGLLNHRGLSGRQNRLATAYHAGFTKDIDLVARGLAKRHGPGIAVGFSMGGNALLKWLGEIGQNAPLRAAAAISVPFQLAPAAEQLQAGRWRLYDRRLTACLRSFTQRKFARMSPPFALPDLKLLKTLREFDDRITAPLHGFTDADDYYKQSSCLPWLQQIAVPTLIINALDDPLIPRSSLPVENDLSPAVTLALSNHGGHVGFLGRGRAFPRFKLNDYLLDYFESPALPRSFCQESVKPRAGRGRDR